MPQIRGVWVPTEKVDRYLARHPEITPAEAYGNHQAARPGHAAIDAPQPPAPSVAPSAEPELTLEQKRAAALAKGRETAAANRAAAKAAAAAAAE